MKKNLWNVPQFNKEKPKDGNIVTGWTWKPWDLDRLCPLISTDTGSKADDECHSLSFTVREATAKLAASETGRRVSCPLITFKVQDRTCQISD